MAVKIRLARRGRKKLALYDVVVADARSPRDGRFIERIGRYNPNTDPATVDLDEEKAFDWVMKGAQPTDTVRAMLSYRGIMLKKHLQIGVNKGAITQEEADKKFNAWVEEKNTKIEAKRDRIAKEAASEAKARKDAETKVKEARAEALRKKAQEAEVEAKAEDAAESGEEATAEVEAPEAEEAPKAETEVEETSEVETSTTEEAPKAEAPEAEATEEGPKAEEAPAAEAKEEAKEEEAPAAEEKKEEPKAEAKEESADEAKEEEEKKEGN